VCPERVGGWVEGGAWWKTVELGTSYYFTNRTLHSATAPPRGTAVKGGTNTRLGVCSSITAAVLRPGPTISWSVDILEGGE